MEGIATIRKLKLNKKTISTLNNFKTIENNTSIPVGACRPTDYCTDPECASVLLAGCRTDHYQSCAPCGPTKGDPLPYTKGC